MIVVTGATGQLGHLTVESLLGKVPAGQIVAAVRNPEMAADFAAKGVLVREADYSRPETLAAAFAGAEKVLLISSNEVGQRIAQHKAVIDAAKAAGVKLIAYTSLLRVDTSKMKLAEEHLATEEYLRASGLPFTLLRNGWYLENHTASLSAALAHGTIIGVAGEGRFSAAARADYADAAATVLTTEGHENKVYELGGDTSYNYAELAAEVSVQSGKPVVYAQLTEQDYAAALQSFGLPAELAAILADSDAQAATGALETDSRDLSKLAGHPTLSMKEAVAAALKA